MFQKNDFIQESIPEPGKLARLKTDSPEVYAAFVRQFELDAEHNREMDRQSIAIDAEIVPMLPMNDRLGILVSGAVALALIGLGFYAVAQGNQLGWLVGALGGLPMIIAVLRHRPEKEP